MKDLLANNRILFGIDETTQPRNKYLLKDNIYENIPSLLYYGGSDTAFLESINVPFDTPKVVDVCKEHIVSLTKNDDIILDFFSGSATIAHAVMQANADDNGNRRYIMVQIPEMCDKGTPLNNAGFDNICAAGKKRIELSAKHIDGKFDGGFRVLKLDSTNMKDVYYNPDELTIETLMGTVDNIKEDRTPEDLLFQVMLDLGVLLSSKIEQTVIGGKTVYNVADGFLIACFDENVTEETITAVAKMKPYYFVMRDSSMASDSVAANFDQIFEAYSKDTVRRVM